MPVLQSLVFAVPLGERATLPFVDAVQLFSVTREAHDDKGAATLALPARCLYHDQPIQLRILHILLYQRASPHFPSPPSS
jgi:hypothetical protein